MKAKIPGRRVNRAGERAMETSRRQVTIRAGQNF